MNRAENAGNCGADPHFASRHSLSNAAIEVLENRCLLSGAHDYIWREAENYTNSVAAVSGHEWQIDSNGNLPFSGSAVTAEGQPKVKYEYNEASSSAAGLHRDVRSGG